MIEAMSGWARKIPGWVWLGAGCLLVAAFWLHQHDARIRQQAELQQVRKQTSSQVAALEKQAGQDVERANVENAKALQQIEARRRQIEQQNRQLTAQLTRLRMQAQTQADEVATLPIEEVASRVAAQLGLKPEDLAAVGGDDVVAQRSSSNAAVLARRETTPSRQGAKAQRNAAESGDRTSPLQRPGGEITAAATPGNDDVVAQRSSSNAAVLARNPGEKPQGQKKGPALQKPGGEITAVTTPVVMALTGSGARKVETALVDLNACRAESNIENQQAANCQARAEADDAAIQRLNGSVASLNQALKAKDRVLGRQASEYKAELRAARGTFFGRLAHATEHVAIGMAVGVAIGVALR